MKETVAVIVATFGLARKHFWDELSRRAVASVAKQTTPAFELKRVHVDDENALHVARNRGAAMCSADWLIFLDADDTLDERYIEQMLLCDSQSDIRVPKIERFYWDGKHDEPQRIQPGKTLLNWSHIVIGAMIRREMFIKAGGFESWPVFEDWHFWMKCWTEGAKFSNSEAVYQSYIRPESRNTQAGAIKWALPIRDSIIPKARERGLIGADWR